MQSQNSLTMKKIALLLSVVFFTGTLYSQISFGPKIGLNVSKLSTDLAANVSSLTESSKTGFQFGAYVRLGTKYYIQPELLYSVKGGILEVVGDVANPLNGNSEYKMGTMDIPVLVGTKLFSLPMVNVRAFAGPIASFIISKDLTIGNIVPDTDDIKLKSAIWSAAIGAGVDVMMFTFDVRYEFGLNNISDDAVNIKSMKSNTFNVSLGWKIF